MTVISNLYLIKADIFRILSWGFSYPDKKKLDELKIIISELLEQEDLKKEYRQFLNQILSQANPDLVLPEYSRLFMKGTVPTTESYCCSKLNSTTDVAAFYNAFGMIPKPGDSPDSITYQLEFMALLLVKLSLAENEEQYSVTDDARKKFIKDHLDEFSLKFSEKLNEKNPVEFYRQLSILLRLVVQDEAQQFHSV